MRPMLSAAIGDAYGAAFEYADPDEARPNDLGGYYGHPRHPTGAGHYTDDTEMSTAVLEAMLEGPLSRESLARWFVSAFKREQRVGYAHGFYRFLLSVKDGDDFLQRIRPHSDKSGAAMRGWVIGFYPRLDDVLTAAELQAKLTHDTVTGVLSAQAAAMMTHYFCHDRGPKEALRDYLAQYLPDGPWRSDFSGPVGPTGTEAVAGALHAIERTRTMSALLRACVALRGDVDTVATIALGAAACCRGFVQDLPAILVENLENGRWGRPYLNALDARLAAWRHDGGSGGNAGASLVL